MQCPLVGKILPGRFASRQLLWIGLAKKESNLTQFWHPMLLKLASNSDIFIQCFFSHLGLDIFGLRERLL